MNCLTGLTFDASAQQRTSAAVFILQKWNGVGFGTSGISLYVHMKQNLCHSSNKEVSPKEIRRFYYLGR